jgi:hypothetical protein
VAAAPQGRRAAVNLGLYRSRHAAFAALLVLAFLGWHLLAPLPFGSRDDGNVWFLLATGWVAVALYVALALYAVRRAAHRLRLSPEFGWKVKLPDLERAQSQLAVLQNRVVARELRTRASIRLAAAQVLRRTGTSRVLRIGVERDPETIGQWRLHVGPREPLGRLANWLHAHLYYGVAAAVVVWFHGGLRTATTMGLLLNALSCFVIASGLLGIALWTFAPKRLGAAEREVSLEKAFALRAHYERKVAAAGTALAAAAGRDDAARLQRDLAVLQGQRDRIERHWRRLAVLRAALRGWRLLHVPCSLLLLALVAVHVLSIWHY